MIFEHTKWIGKEVYRYDTLPSTNQKAKELAATGCSSGTLVTAESQSAGIGRRGRSWSSEADTGIYMSLVLRPEVTPELAPMLTLVAALSVAKAIEHLLVEKAVVTPKPMIKWPNDIVMNGKKICGILTEMTLEKSHIDSVIVGIGINVSNYSFPEVIRDTASSIYLETSQSLDRDRLIEEVWKYFEKYYDQFLQLGNLTGVKEEYENLLANKNEKVNVLDPKGAYTGIAMGITNTGELLVDTGSSIEAVDSGEVSVRGIYGYV